MAAATEFDTVVIPPTVPDIWISGPASSPAPGGTNRLPIVMPASSPIQTE